MSLHEEYDDYLSSEYSYDYSQEDLSKKKRIKKLLEDRLERKRLKAEFEDDFDELNGEFDWSELDK